MFFAVLVFPPDGHKCSSNGPKVPNGGGKLLTPESQVDSSDCGGKMLECGVMTVQTRSIRSGI